MEKINISFAGCGFLGIYHIGVASCIKEYAPHLFLNKISGASIGAISGCCLLCNVSLGTFTSEMLNIIYVIRRHALGPFNPMVNVHSMLKNLLAIHLPKNAYKLVSGKLFISMTRVNDGSNFIVSEFQSNEELIDALAASAFVPVFSGFIPPKFGKYRYLDGGFSNNLPILDENTITVSPFCGESDICPRDSSMQLFHVNLCNTSIEVSKPNIYRFARVLFPHSPEVLSMMCKQGFDDALKFLQRNNLISCTKCLAVSLPVAVPGSHDNNSYHRDDQHEMYDPECEECNMHRQLAAGSNLPETMSKFFEDAMITANKGLVNWIFKHRGMKVISVLTLPYQLTADIIRATVKKFIEITPLVLESCVELTKILLQILVNAIEESFAVSKETATKIAGKLSLSTYVDEGTGLRKESMVRNRSFVSFSYDQQRKLETNKEGVEMNVVGSSARVRNASVVDSGITDDTYEHILEVIEQHEALMAFYYMDDQNKMKLMEIFDVTDGGATSAVPVDGGVADVTEVVPASATITHSVIDTTHKDMCETWTLGNADIDEPMDHLTATLLAEKRFDEKDDARSLSTVGECDSSEELGGVAASSDPESDWNHEEDHTRTRFSEPEANRSSTLNRHRKKTTVFSIE